MQTERDGLDKLPRNVGRFGVVIYVDLTEHCSDNTIYYFSVKLNTFCQPDCTVQNSVSPF